MFNLHKLLTQISTFQWSIILFAFIIWISIAYYAGQFSEKKWGDRESGVLLGFFIPMTITAVILFYQK